jgi:hypothetical protein
MVWLSVRIQLMNQNVYPAQSEDVLCGSAYPGSWLGPLILTVLHRSETTCWAGKALVRLGDDWGHPPSLGSGAV